MASNTDFNNKNLNQYLNQIISKFGIKKTLQDQLEEICEEMQTQKDSHFKANDFQKAVALQILASEDKAICAKVHAGDGKSFINIKIALFCAKNCE